MTKEKTCPLCKGKQWLYECKDEVVVPKRCKCLEKKLFQEYIGNSDVYNAKWVKKSPLYAPSENDPVDRTTDDLFLKGTWEIVCRHLRWVLSGKYLYSPEFAFKIMDDDRLLNVWLGKERYDLRPSGVRNVIETNNCLSDLLSDPDLVILYLGAVKRNRAMPDVLYEALTIRRRRRKATWIIAGDDGFSHDSATYSEKVNSYIGENFDIIDLGGNVEELREIKKVEAQEAFDNEIAMGPGIEVTKSETLEKGSRMLDADTIEIPEKQRKPYEQYKKRKNGLPDV